MSPSRIPRPGAVPGSGIGTTASGLDPRCPTPQSVPGSGFRSPAQTTSGFKPNNPFARPGAHQQHLQTQSASPPARTSPLVQQQQQLVRRRKPPSPQMDEGSLSPPPATSRRPVPIHGGGGSPDMSALPRAANSPRSNLGPGQGYPQGLPQGGVGQLPRSCLRQPSTPALSSADRRQVPQSDPRPRLRAMTTSAPPSMPTSASAQLRAGHIFEPSFAESREPAVPPHIRIRLRLIHQLGVVLGIDAQGISSKIDIPGLLARVDAAYDRGGGVGGDTTGMGREGSQGTLSQLPLPIRTGSDIGGSLNGTESAGGPVSAAVGMRLKVGGGVDAGRGGMFGVFKKWGRKSLPEEAGFSPGPAFGVPLNEAPLGGWCTSLIGGQRHELPLVVFTVVEEIYRRGMSQPGIFRLAGDGTRISHLIKVFNLPPLYGDSLSISQEPIHNLTGLVKRYVRDLPEPILDESLFPAFLSFCAEPEPGALVLPLSTRVTAAQIMLKLLPPLHFSLFIYLLAFLGQLPLFPDNRLNVESISIIFGPAMCAARGKGISGLGPSTNSTPRGIEHDPEEVSNLVNQSQSTLAWLLRNWGPISEKVLDPPFEEEKALEDKVKEKKEEQASIDPRLLSPIDLRAKQETPFRRPVPSNLSLAQVQTQTQIQTQTPGGQDVSRDSSTESAASDTASSGSSISPSTPSPPVDVSADVGIPSSRSFGSDSVSAGGGGGGIFARAFSSRSISSQAEGREELLSKPPKRSASFTSLSSLVKKGGVLIQRMDPKSVIIPANKSMSDDRSVESRATVNPQISNVLGSLHDLLVSKDKQIERDARELALLRHTLLEMDEKLQRTSSPSNPNLTHQSAPAITITATPSITSSLATAKEITDLHSQLTTALAGLETARQNTHKGADRVLELETRLARCDSEKRLELGKLEVALALEQAKVVGLGEERDLARERLEKVKMTLFSVA